MKKHHFKILVIEDDSNQKEIYRHILRTDNYFSFDMLSTPYGQEGKQLYQYHNIDCVLLDYNLPDISGLDFIKELKNTNELTLKPIIMLTGMGNEEIAVKALQLGASDYLSKDQITEGRLSAAIRENVKNYKSTIELKQKEKELHETALQDPLTQLPNRRAFYDELKRCVARAKRHSHLGALLYIDLDGFKKVNDTYGHSIGDKLLAYVSQKLLQIVRDGDMVARLGGDEFAIILSDITDEISAGKVADKVYRGLNQFIPIENLSVSIGASIGIACFVRDTDCIQTLIQQADIAMYKAKGDKHNSYLFFVEKFFDAHNRYSQIENELTNSIIRNELHLCYQPIIDLRTQQILSFEALLRWRSANLNQTIAPNKFIPMAEKNGYIEKISFWLLEEVVKQYLIWTKTYRYAGKVSINLSQQQLISTAFVNELKRILCKNSLGCEKVNIEVTEKVAMLEEKSITCNLRSLLNMGVELHIDDFGSDYSSISRLRSLHVSALKIDRKLVSSIGDIDVNTIIVSIISLAKALNLNVIAEGVETKKQEDFLVASGCIFGQGFLYSRPIEKEKVINLFSK